MNLNDWNKDEVARAEKTWGHKVPPFLDDMYSFAIHELGAKPTYSAVKSWLDLGCGFGRFLEELDATITEPDYIGYDSSADMVARCRKRFPAYAPTIFERDITEPIVNSQQSVICAAVLIHLPLPAQQRILQNVAGKRPVKFTFDINSLNEQEIRRTNLMDRRFQGTHSQFRMTWQSHYEMTKQVLAIFPDYHLDMSFYDLQRKCHKVVYKLTRKGANLGEMA